MCNFKRFASASTALILTLGLAACSSSSDNTSSEYVDQVEVEDTDEIEAIPEGAETELEWLSYFDINPTSTAEEKRVDLDLFEKKGGTITYSACSSVTKYDQLASRVLSNDPPDIFWYEQKMTFPCYCIKGMFQPVDSIVDFEDDMWVDMKDLADQFELGGEHYVAPINLEPLSVLTYDKDVIEGNSLEDPYDLYMSGDWTWDTWYDLMDSYVSSATGDEVRYGINGWFGAFIFQSTGKTLIKYDEETDEYVSNIDDPDFDRASTMLYNIQKNGLYYSDWIGSASEAFRKNILFYAMGTWAVSPSDGDNWGIVPMPRDPNTDTYYTTIGITAYMWVNGSEKSDAVKCWYECARVANTDAEYVEAGKEKFFVTSPNWSEEMYEMANVEPISDKYVKVVDPGYGISTLLSNDDAATNATKEAVIPYLYSSVMKSDDDGTQFTWTKLRETYSNTIDSELETFNEEYHEFIGE
ncbi:MAG: extracellular solute-binding protein [Ruminococcus sp.]|nr:extracellular solute-binding protein [Ruminococcus sp.]